MMRGEGKEREAESAESRTRTVAKRIAETCDPGHSSRRADGGEAAGAVSVRPLNGS